MIALADELGLDRFVVGGISLGAGTALNLTLRYPERVAGWCSADRPGSTGRRPSSTGRRTPSSPTCSTTVASRRRLAERYQRNRPSTSGPRRRPAAAASLLRPTHPAARCGELHDPAAPFPAASPTRRPPRGPTSRSPPWSSDTATTRSTRTTSPRRTPTPSPGPSCAPCPARTPTPPASPPQIRAALHTLPARTAELIPMEQPVVHSVLIAVDLGGTQIRTAVAAGRALLDRRSDRHAADGPDGVIAAVVAEIRQPKAAASGPGRRASAPSGRSIRSRRHRQRADPDDFDHVPSGRQLRGSARAAGAGLQRRERRRGRGMAARCRPRNPGLLLRHREHRHRLRHHQQRPTDHRPDRLRRRIRADPDPVARRHDGQARGGRAAGRRSRRPRGLRSGDR